MKQEPSPQTIFHQALEITAPEERATYLASACGDDNAPRREVESLLAAHEAAHSFLEPIVTPEPATPGEQSGDRIGHYKLLELIGEGGFGRIWMALGPVGIASRVSSQPRASKI